MLIGTVVKRTGCTKDTIRYYEEYGLITPKRDPRNGYKVYSEADTNTLLFVRVARDMGFSLREIKTIMSLAGSRNPKRADLVTLAKEKIEALTDRIRYMEGLRTMLERAITQPLCAPDSDCPSVEGLNPFSLEPDQFEKLLLVFQSNLGSRPLFEEAQAEDSHGFPKTKKAT